MNKQIEARQVSGANEIKIFKNPYFRLDDLNHYSYIMAKLKRRRK